MEHLNAYHQCSWIILRSSNVWKNLSIYYSEWGVTTFQCFHTSDRGDHGDFWYLLFEDVRAIEIKPRSGDDQFPTLLLTSQITHLVLFLPQRPPVERPRDERWPVGEVTPWRCTTGKTVFRCYQLLYRSASFAVKRVNASTLNLDLRSCGMHLAHLGLS